jgi:hypothetical protein
MLGMREIANVIKYFKETQNLVDRMNGRCLISLGSV